MIVRIVLVKLKQEFTDEDTRDSVADYSREALRRVPGVRDVSVTVPADERSGKDWDLCMRIRFEGMDAVQPYIDDPGHRAYVDDYLRPKLEVIKAWNFKSPALS